MRFYFSSQYSNDLLSGFSSYFVSSSVCKWEQWTSALKNFFEQKKTIQIKSLFKRNVQRVEMSVIHVIYNDVHFWMKNVSNDVYDWLRIFSLALDTKMLLKSKPLRSFEVSQLKCYTIKLIPGHKCTINNFCKCFIDGITHTLVLLQISCQNSVVFLWINR